MFAPAFVGVTLLSVATSEEVPWRRSVTNRNVRGPVGAPRPAVASASINLDRRRAGLGVSVSGYRSKGRREAAHTARCITSMGVVHDASKDVASYQRPARQRGSADRKPAQGMPEFNR